jgi:predicted negative regulator of RcsB-dependent stress response
MILFFGLLGLGGLALWFALRRPDVESGQPEQYVLYKNLLRTTDFGKLTLLRSLLDNAGIRHYSSQANVLHLGEAQLFVERDRFEHAEAILYELDQPTED